MLHRNDIIQIKSNSWGPDDTGDVIEGPGTLTAEALREAAVSGRGGWVPSFAGPVATGWRTAMIPILTDTRIPSMSSLSGRSPIPGTRPTTANQEPTC